jgi:hypothetical protein
MSGYSTPTQWVDQLRSQGALVVRVDATPAALRENLFGKALYSNQIVLDSGPTRELAEQDTLTEGEGASKPAPSYSQAVEEPLDQDAEADDTTDGAGRQIEQQIELVVVDATAGQIAGALSDLTRQRDQFPQLVDLSDGRDVRDSLSVFKRQTAVDGDSERRRQAQRADLSVAPYGVESKEAIDDGMAAGARINRGPSQGKLGAMGAASGRGGASPRSDRQPEDEEDVAERLAEDEVMQRKVAGASRARLAPQQVGRARRMSVRLQNQMQYPLGGAQAAPPAAPQQQSLANVRATGPTEQLRLYFLIRPVEAPLASPANAAPPD